MTIERVQGFTDLYEISCDGCSDGETVDAPSFQDAVRLAKDRGYRITKEDGDWKHYCGSCWEDRR